eukprot:CAMPEP_0204322354 /NCGR_PEP_ID=MMETSP0469-20131031/8644_1 /ASSEMBLY_ACC=CAM_ASM_000384 /TAXON_ID=2969 /ORGANISM="Oxyrrhis marina" /LENGTH=120 /DNA_ID=CAMNT_0051303693 /DNA_START=320 /DNA_END=680 /DNA_ORIENTATION=-
MPWQMERKRVKDEAHVKSQLSWLTAAAASAKSSSVSPPVVNKLPLTPSIPAQRSAGMTCSANPVRGRSMWQLAITRVRLPVLILEFICRAQTLVPLHRAILPTDPHMAAALSPEPWSTLE